MDSNKDYGIFQPKTYLTAASDHCVLETVDPPLSAAVAPLASPPDGGQQLRDGDPYEYRPENVRAILEMTASREPGIPFRTVIPV
jgi:hypothetical protein